MRIREFADADLVALKRMHAAQGFDYPFPDLEDPIFLVKLVVEDEARNLVMASLLRLTSEAYLLHDPSRRGGSESRSLGTRTPLPKLRDLPSRDWERFLMLHEATRRAALRRGLRDVHCWLPPQVAKSFGRRLLRLGWERPLWVDFVQDL